MAEIESRLASLAQKALSEVRAVRLRAYRNLLSKLSLSARGAFAERALAAEHLEDALRAAERSVARAMTSGGGGEDAEEVLLACELCMQIAKESAFHEWLRRAAGMKRIALDTLVTTLHEAVDSEEPLDPRVQSACQDVYNALCSVRSHIDPEDTQLFPVEEPSNALEATISDGPIRNVSRKLDILHVDAEDEALYMHGWKFPTVFLSPLDDKHLMEMQTRLLSAPDDAQTLSVLLELRGGAIADYPAPVFLQQPGFLLSLLQLLSLPDTNVVMGTNWSQDSTTEAVKAAVLDALLELAHSIIAAVRLHMDGRFSSVFEGRSDATDGEDMPPDAAEHYLVNRVQQYRYPRYDQILEHDQDHAVPSRIWSIGGAMYAFCARATPLLRSSQPQLLSKACVLIATCLPYCIDPSLSARISHAATRRLEHMAQLLAQTISYFETLLPLELPCERNLAAALNMLVTRSEGSDSIATLSTSLLCCSEVIIRFFDTVAGRLDRGLDAEEFLAVSPLLSMLERVCFDLPLRVFAGERIVACENLLCQINPAADEQLRLLQDFPIVENHEEQLCAPANAPGPDVIDTWAATWCDQQLQRIADARSHRQLTDACFELLASASLRAELALHLTISNWESAMGRILQVAPSTAKDHEALDSVMQCMSLILRPANFGPHQHPLFLRQCLGVIMSESQEAAFAGTSAANQQYVSFSLQRSLLQLVLNVCTTVQVIGTVLGDDDDDDEWQQFIHQIVASQWLPKAVTLLKHAVTSYNTFRGVALVRLILRTFESLYQLGHREILLTRVGLSGEVSAEEDTDLNPSALTYINRAAKSVSLPDSFRGGCIRLLALEIMQLVAATHESDRAAMERIGALSRDKQWLLRLATDRRAEIRYFALEWYQIVGGATAESTGIVPDWLVHMSMDAAEAPIVRLRAMSLAVDTCVTGLLSSDGECDEADADHDVDDSSAGNLPVMRMLFAAACEYFANREERSVSAHGLLTAVRTVSLVVGRLFPMENTTGSASQRLLSLQGDIMRLVRTHRLVPRLVELLTDEILLKRLSHSYHSLVGAPSSLQSTYLPGWDLVAARAFAISHIAAARDVQAGACVILRALFSAKPELQHESIRHTSVFHNAVSMIFNVKLPRRGTTHSYRALCNACDFLSALLANPSPAMQALTSYAPSIGYSILLSLTSHMSMLMQEARSGIDFTPMLRLAALVFNTKCWRDGIHWLPPSDQQPLTTDLDLRILPSILISLATSNVGHVGEQNAEAAVVLLSLIVQHQPNVFAHTVADASEQGVQALLAPIQDVCRLVCQQSIAARKSTGSQSRVSKTNPFPGMARPYTNPKWRGGAQSFNTAENTTLSSIPAEALLSFDAAGVQALFYSTCFLQACMDAAEIFSATSFQLLRKSAACMMDVLRIWQQAYTSNRPEVFVYARPLGHVVLTTLTKMQDTFTPQEFEQLAGADWASKLLKVVRNSRLDSNSRCIASVCLQNASNPLLVRSAALAELQHVLDSYTHRTRRNRQHHQKADTLFQLCALIHILAACLSVNDLDAKEKAAASAGMKDDPPLIPLLDWAVQVGTELAVADGCTLVPSLHGDIHPSLALAVLHACGALCASESRRLRANMLSESALLLLCGFAQRNNQQAAVREKVLLCVRALLAGSETTRALMKNNDKMCGLLSEVDEEMRRRAAVATMVA